MTSKPDVRIAIIEQMAEALLDLNDPGDWTSDEVAEARDSAEEYANTILEMFSIDVVEAENGNFTLTGRLANVREFMDKHFSEPLVSE